MKQRSIPRSDVILIVITLTFCQITEAYLISNTSESESDNTTKGDLLDKHFILYDVTSALHDDTRHADGKINYIFPRNNLLPYFYEANANISNHACGSKKIGFAPSSSRRIPFLCGRDFGITGISVMFTGNAMVTDLSNLFVKETKTEILSNVQDERLAPYLDSVIFLLGANFSDNSCFSSESKTIEYFNKTLKNLEKVNTSTINLGIEYNQRFIERCKNEKVALFQYVKLTVLRVDVHQWMRSYETFSENISLEIKKNRDYVREHGNSNCKLYVRLVCSIWKYAEPKKEYNDRYETWIAKYLESWEGDEIFIVRSSPKESLHSEVVSTQTSKFEEDYSTEINSSVDSTKHMPSDNSDDNLIYLYTLLPIGLLVSLAILLLWLQRRHYKKQLLTGQEIIQFYNGEKSNGYESDVTEDYCLYSAYMAFPQSCEICLKDIEIQGVVGRGEFGVVHKGTLEKRVEVAIKKPRPECTKEQFKSILSELKILCYIGSHSNIVSFLGAYTKEIREGKLLILSEFCGKGSLEKYLRSLQPSQQPIMQTDGSYCLAYDLNKMYRFAQQIASGMEYVAAKRIVHGDLATRNVLLTSDFICKISDFGLSRRLYEMSVYRKTSSQPLPWMWMAPESLKNMEFTTKSDVWSYGVTLWEIFNLGRRPYPGKRLTEDFIWELDSGVRMERPHLASETIYNTMLDCWCHFKDNRPTFTTLKEYFADLQDHSYQNSSVIIA